MKAKKLHLLNYCQHRDLTVEFDPDAGLVGIVGEMGAGKSNVVGAIAAAVSGNFDRNKKSRLVTLGEKVGSIDGAGPVGLTRSDSNTRRDRNITVPNSERHAQRINQLVND